MRKNNALTAGFLACLDSSTDKADFVKTWANISPSLEVLSRYLKRRHSESFTIRGDDFDSPNHYAKLAFEAGKRAAYEEIMQLLPESSE